MPSRTIEDSIAIRAWIERALKDGKRNPRAIQEYIEQNSSLDPSPTLPTIGNIMKNLGYSPAGSDWVKKGNNHERK
jgi:hypothetical protein